MMQVLTEEQSVSRRKSDELKMKAWWETITYNERKLVFDQYAHLFEQVKCEHKWNPPVPFYSQMVKRCSLCNLSLEVHSNEFYVRVKDDAPNSHWYFHFKDKTFKVKTCYSKSETRDVEGVGSENIENIFIVTEGDYKTNVILRDHCTVIPL